MRNNNFIKVYKKLTGYILLVIFCGYLGSITFFPHTHIVEGITIVHSHPYKSQSGVLPVDHSHLKNGFILIQFISNFITVAPFLFLGLTIIRKLLKARIPVYEDSFNLNSRYFFSCFPRAPSL